MQGVAGLVEGCSGEPARWGLDFNVWGDDVFMYVAIKAMKYMYRIGKRR